MADETTQEAPGIDYQQLASAMAGNQDTSGNYTTPQARTEAKSFLDEYKGYMSSDSPEQQQLYSMYGKTAEGARKILQAARERIANMQRPEDTLRALAMQQGVDEPIQGHDYGELFGHVREKLLQNKLGGIDFENQRQEKLTEIDQAINATDNNQLAARLQLLKEKITQSGQIAGKAMTVFGKIDTPGKYNTPGALGPDPASPAAKVLNGYQAGVPELSWDPFQQIPDPKQRATAVMAETKAGLTDLEKNYGATSQQQQARIATIDEMDRLNATGKIRWGSALSNIDSALGNRLPAGFYNDAEQAYLKDSQVLARQARMPGERYSQWDGKILQSMVPGIPNDSSTAAFMRKSIKAAAQNTLDYIDFKKNYIRIHGTDTGDADKAWDEYTNSPDGRIFELPEDGQVPKDITKIGLNDKRIPWKQYFRRQYESKYPGIGTLKFAEGGRVLAPSKVLDMFHQYKDGMTGGDDGVDDFTQRLMNLRARYAEGGQVTPTDDELEAYLSGKISRPSEEGSKLEPSYVKQAMRDAIADSGRNLPMGGVTSVASGIPGALPAAALLASLMPGGDYNSGMRKLHGDQSLFDREYPHVPSRIAGSLMTPGVGQLYGWAGRGANLLSRIGKTGVANASLGAAYGASDAESGDRLSAARVGALDNLILGPVLGKAGQLAAKYGIRGLRGLGGWAGSAIDSNLGTHIGDTLRNPTGAEERLSGALQTDTGSPGGGVPGASLLDAGPDTQALIRAAARRSPEASETISGALEARDAARRQGADDLLNKTFAPSEPFGEESRILDRLRKQSALNWQRAYQNGTNIPGGPAIDKLMKSPTGQLAMQDAGRTLADKGVTPPMLTGANATPMTTEYLDEVRQQLESQYQRAGTPGSKAAISKLKADLTAHLATTNPDFATAMSEHADDKRLLDALQTGRDKFHTMSPAQADLHINGNGTSEYPGLNFSERDAFMSGAIGDLQKRLLSKSGNPDVAGNLLSTPGMMEKFGTLLNDPNKLRRFSEGLSGLSDQHATDASIRKALKIEPPTEDPTRAISTAAALAAGASGHHPIWGLHGIVSLYKDISNMPEGVAKDISAMVAERDPAKIREIQSRLLQQGVKPEMLQNAMNKSKGVGAIQGALRSAPVFSP